MREQTQAGFFDWIGALVNAYKILVHVLTIIKTYSGNPDAEFLLTVERSPRGQFIGRWDIPLIERFVILEVKALGQTLYCGYIDI